MKDKQRKLISLEASWVVKSAKIEETDGRLKSSKTETQEAINEFKEKVIATQDKLQTLKEMKQSLIEHRQQTVG